jgi:hypothetical protein
MNYMRIFQKYKVKEGLISSGKLDTGGSVLMIDHMVKAGKIEKTENYNVYKISKSVTTTEDEEWADMR